MGTRTIANADPEGKKGSMHHPGTYASRPDNRIVCLSTSMPRALPLMS